MKIIGFVDFLKLMDCRSPAEFEDRFGCLIDESGIRREPIDKHTQSLLIGDEWMVVKQSEQDMKLDLPCTAEQFVDWAKRNGLMEIDSSDDAEQIFNDEPIDWKYWAIMPSISNTEAAKLAFGIDPIKYSGNDCSLGRLPDAVQNEIKKLERWLECHSQTWTLAQLVENLGNNRASAAMQKAASEWKPNKPIGSAQQQLNDYALAENPETMPTLEYGEPELSINYAITLYQALNILGDEFTYEVFALGLLDGDIQAFEKRNETEKLRPIVNIKEWLSFHFKAEAFSGELYDVDLILEKFRYSKPNLFNFKSQTKPELRYIAFNQACKRVAEFKKGSIEAAEIKLRHGLNYAQLYAHHPLSGRLNPEQSCNGEFWKKCYFQNWMLTKWIEMEFGELAAKPEVEAVKTEIADAKVAQAVQPNEIQAEVQSANENESMSNDGASSQDGKQDKTDLTKLEKQQNAILEVIKQKQLIPMRIPDGEKGAIKLICEADYVTLFEADSAFDRAWKKGVKKLWKMDNHESYARRGRD